ncbi:response regulator [Roseivirga pacifica]|uniref:response regulator n=1 Tax=Roseivirga pacifica TaxID=1267423 RepID=UPI00227B4518|nr:response regulator transcription factor [Roseivirga pacifica]
MIAKIRVLIVDDHTMIRDALRNYFVNDDRIEVVNQAKNGKEALEKVAELDLDLVLTDISMPVMDGHDLAQALKADYPSLKVIVLSMINESKQIKRMLATGVDGYVLKNCDKEELAAGIKQVMEGESYYSPNVVHKIMEGLSKRNGTERSVIEMPLSSREKEVLKLVMKEYSNSEIANELFISVRTVEAHKRNLLEKTGSKNLVGLAIYAVEKGLID